MRQYANETYDIRFILPSMDDYLQTNNGQSINKVDRISLSVKCIIRNESSRIKVNYVKHRNYNTL